MPDKPSLLHETESRAELMARQLVERLTAKQCRLALAESCTAGLVADLTARVSGASAVLWGSYVCYTHDAKQRMLRISDRFLGQYGLVSRETAREMAINALGLSHVSIAGAVTGLAGPLGDGSHTSVGTIWVAVAQQDMVMEKEFHFEGTRAEIRMQAAAAVLEELLNAAARIT